MEQPSLLQGVIELQLLEKVFKETLKALIFFQSVLAFQSRNIHFQQDIRRRTDCSVIFQADFSVGLHLAGLLGMESKVNSKCSRGLMSVTFLSQWWQLPAIVRAMGLAVRVYPQEGAVWRGTALSVCLELLKAGWRVRAEQGMAVKGAARLNHSLNCSLASRSTGMPLERDRQRDYLSPLHCPIGGEGSEGISVALTC